MATITTATTRGAIVVGGTVGSVYHTSGNIGSLETGVSDSIRPREVATVVDATRALVRGTEPELQGGAAAQFIGPTAIASAEAFGSTTVSLSISGVGAIASATVLGTAKVNLTVQGVGAIATGQAFGAAKVNLTVTGVGAIASGEAIGATTVLLSINGAAIGSGEAFGQASILTTGPQTVTAAGITSSEAMGSPLVILTPQPSTGGARGRRRRTIGIYQAPPPAIEIRAVGDIRSAEAFGVPGLVLADGADDADMLNGTGVLFGRFDEMA